MDHSSIPSQYCHLGLDPDNVMVGPRLHDSFIANCIFYFREKICWIRNETTAG